MAHLHDCKDLLEPLSDYISGDAAESLCAEIEAHMAECEDCRVMVDTLKKTILLYRAVKSDELPGDVRRRLYQRLDLSTFLIE
jgi:predicted anti-sigma-YlaC factor YlaD